MAVCNIHLVFECARFERKRPALIANTSSDHSASGPSFGSLSGHDILNFIAGVQDMCGLNHITPTISTYHLLGLDSRSSSILFSSRNVTRMYIHTVLPRVSEVKDVRRLVVSETQHLLFFSDLSFSFLFSSSFSFQNASCQPRHSRWRQAQDVNGAFTQNQNEAQAQAIYCH